MYKDVLVLACEGVVYITQAPNNIKRSDLIELARVELNAPVLNCVEYITNPNYEDIDHKNSITVEY